MPFAGQAEALLREPLMPSASQTSPDRARQLGLGLVVMMAISSPQYVWTLFLRSFEASTGAALPAVQVTFSLLIVVQTLFSPAQGWLVDRFGPRRLVGSGAALTGLGWVLSAHVSSLILLYLTYGALCGIGTGIVYVGIVGLMARWFPDRRGFAIGVVAAGYGMGAMLTTFPIATMLSASGAPATLTLFGLLFGGVGVIAALGLREPRAGEAPAPSTARGRDTEPRAMLKTPIFWLMFAMMTMMSTGGLMVTSNFAAFARDFGVADVRVWGVAALPLALTIDRLMNGFTRPFFGWVSDRLGRENTMGLAFLLEGAAILLLLEFRGDAIAFVLLSGLVFFGWGEIFSLFPSTLTDTFGAKHATTNYGFLYIAQGVGSVLGGPVAAALHEKAGGWTLVFALAAAMDALTGLLALFELKAMRGAYAAADVRSEEVRGSTT
jgi:OFA family oxalate/formate antiporter-like MFS transporter